MTPDSLIPVLAEHFASHFVTTAPAYKHEKRTCIAFGQVISSNLILTPLSLVHASLLAPEFVVALLQRMSSFLSEIGMKAMVLQIDHRKVSRESAWDELKLLKGDLALRKFKRIMRQHEALQGALRRFSRLFSWRV